MWTQNYVKMLLRNVFKSIDLGKNHPKKSKVYKTITSTASPMVPDVAHAVPPKPPAKDSLQWWKKYCETWNCSRQDPSAPLFHDQGPEFGGVHDSYIFLGMWASTFSWHVEDQVLFIPIYNFSLYNTRTCMGWIIYTAGHPRPGTVSHLQKHTSNFLHSSIAFPTCTESMSIPSMR